MQTAFLKIEAMTNIYLIRHAQAEGNLYRIVQGHFDSYITVKGYKQIDALAERFRDVKLDALYSSDLRRTVLTAGAITRYHELPMQKTPRLREICLGVCEGMSFGQMYEYDPQQMDYFNNDPDRWRAEGAETFEECTARMVSVLTQIAEENDGKTVAVVSHGMAIRSFLTHVLGVRSEDIRKLPHGDNTAVSYLHYDGGCFTVEYYNDNSHLPEELSTFAKQTWWRSDSAGLDLSNLSYRPIDPRTDGQIYLEYYAEAWRSAHGSLDRFIPELYLRDACRAAESGSGAIYGVYRAGELIGMLELDLKRGTHAGYGWISLICLKPEWRGKGLGIQPLGYAITRYQALGRRAVRLHVSSENKNAIGFYEHCGFDTLSSEPGAGAPLYLMEKKFK